VAAIIISIAIEKVGPGTPFFYNLELDNTDINFANIIAEPYRHELWAQNLSLEDTELSRFYRFGLYGYCRSDNSDFEEMRCRKVSGIDINEFYAEEMGVVRGQTMKKEHINLPSGFIIAETKTLSGSGFFQVTIPLIAIVIALVGAKTPLDAETAYPFLSLIFMLLLSLSYFVFCFVGIIFFLCAAAEQADIGAVHNHLSYFHHRYMIGVMSFVGCRALYIASVFLIILGLACGARFIVELQGEETRHPEKMN
jgi:hypothetical protein